MVQHRFLIALIAIDVVAVGLLAFAWKTTTTKDAGAQDLPVVAVTEVGRAAAAEPAVADGIVVPSQVARVFVPPGTDARVMRVYVTIGTRVRQGQVLADLDPSPRKADLAQAEASVRQARARYEQVRQSEDPERIRQKALEVERSRQQVREAEERLRLLRAGSAPLEISIAQDAVEAARARTERAATEHQSDKTLFAKDLIARADMEKSETAWIVAKNALDQAQKRLALLQQGPRPEEVSVAEARLRQARLAYEADREVLARLQRGPLPADLTQATEELQRRKIAAGNAAHQLREYRLRAPISGVVVARNVNPGEIAMRGTPRMEGEDPLDTNGRSLFTIADNSTVEFRANVDSQAYHGIYPGQTAQVEIRSLPGQSFSGRIVRKSPRIQVAGSDAEGAGAAASFYAWVRLPNPQRLLVPGQAGTLRVAPVRAAPEPTGPLLPRRALKTYSAGEGVVFVEQNGLVQARSIRYEEAATDTVRVRGGLNSGEKVVISDLSQLADGVRVQAVIVSAGL